MSDPHLNALDKLDADVSTLLDTSSTSLSVLRHIRLLLAIALISRALGLDIGQVDWSTFPTASQLRGVPPTPGLARSE
jgi:hypothetical protein